MKVIPLIFMITLLVGCDNGVLWEDNPYQVAWVDTTTNRTLNYDLGDGGFITRIEAKIIAVGSDDHYIVAKQQSPDVGVISYYYIERQSDQKFANGASGPYTKAQFWKIKKELNLPDFTKRF